jgi:hypothetical protein
MHNGVSQDIQEEGEEKEKCEEEEIIKIVLYGADISNVQESITAHKLTSPSRLGSEGLTN